jgi:hypothetical protein
MTNHHLERALFVVAGRHRGKSTQLRAMFLDARFGNDGVVITGRFSRRLGTHCGWRVDAKSHRKVPPKASSTPRSEASCFQSRWNG